MYAPYRPAVPLLQSPLGSRNGTRLPHASGKALSVPRHHWPERAADAPDLAAASAPRATVSAFRPSGRKGRIRGWPQIRSGRASVTFSPAPTAMADG